jgi:hypothetical protein
VHPGLLAAFADPPAQCVPVVAIPIYIAPASGSAAGQLFANTTELARNEPGVYAAFETNDAGAGLLSFPDSGAPSCGVPAFSGSITQMIDEAKSIGLNSIYLTSWFNGKEGDYKPKPGLQKAIDAIRNAGGRVLLRVEGVLASNTCRLVAIPLIPTLMATAGVWLGPAQSKADV